MRETSHPFENCAGETTKTMAPFPFWVSIMIYAHANKTRFRLGTRKQTKGYKVLRLNINYSSWRHFLTEKLYFSIFGRSVLTENYLRKLLK